MGQPLFLAENFYNVSQFPAHTIVSAFATAPDQEAFRVGTARRSILNGTRNADPTNSLIVDVTADRIREADIIVFDRNSDIAGKTVTLDVSSEVGVFDTRVFVETMPTDVVLGSSLNDPAHMIRTNEGAWLLKFPAVAGLYWRVAVTPLASDSGRLGGVYLGKSFSPTHGGRLPFDDEETWLDFGVVRRGVPDNDVRFGRTGAFSMMMSGEAEWNEARRTFRELFGKGHPMWIAPDSDKAERTWFGYNAPGSVGAAFSERPQGRSVVIRADEYDPRLP